MLSVAFAESKTFVLVTAEKNDIAKVYQLVSDSSDRVHDNWV